MIYKIYVKMGPSGFEPELHVPKTCRIVQLPYGPISKYHDIP